MRKFPKNTYSWVAADYAKRVVSGKTRASWQVRAACHRFIDDFNRTDILFDVARVDDICAFAEAMPHVIGPLAGETITLEPFQVFILANIFGWLVKGTLLRRFREAFILLPRGNAKSTLAAIIALHMTFREGQGGAEGLSGATSLKQAKAVFTPAKRMVEMTPALAEGLGLETHATSIFQPSTGSSFQPVKAKTEDGGLPWVAIADEVHQALDDTQLNAFRTGMGKRRGADPLLIIISTAGTNVAGVCRQEQLYFEGVLNKTLVDDSKFAVIYTIDAEDDWRDFTVWEKANPNYGVSVDENYLRSEYEKALQSPSYQASALTKYLNIWQNTRAGWLNSVDWSKAAKPDLVIPTHVPCWLGVDLALRTDMTAITMVADMGDGTKAITPFIHVPAGSLERSKNATAYADWIASGAIRKSEGNATEYSAIEDQIRTLCKTYNVQAVMFDPHQAAFMIQNLMEEGINAQDYPQTALYMNQPMVDFEADLMNGKVVHSDNPCLNWMSMNASVKWSGAFRKVEKPTGQEHLKVDGIQAMLMAYAGSNMAPPEVMKEVEVFILD